MRAGRSRSLKRAATPATISSSPVLGQPVYLSPAAAAARPAPPDSTALKPVAFVALTQRRLALLIGNSVPRPASRVSRRRRQPARSSAGPAAAAAAASSSSSKQQAAASSSSGSGSSSNSSSSIFTDNNCRSFLRKLTPLMRPHCLRSSSWREASHSSR